ncbi:hypothetical protein CPB84DRAFT_1804614 [Gymnopilus junonius]|uniref:Uncharacterized protein n=1 Tax=Gymnopilus junonius TaxID=109634 RepID=A0A9P5TEI9_GYMJU|nr:hypothetical protein CPB84DRAFT_1804614 [Gymnopilus junonius]
MPDPITITATVLAGASVVQVVQIAGGYKAGPHTTGQYAKAGAAFMDHTMEMLTDPVLSNVIPATERAVMFQTHENLQISRNVVEESTTSFFKSLRHHFDAKEFFKDAEALYNMVHVSSHKALAAAGKQAAQAEMAMNNRRQIMSNATPNPPTQIEYYAGSISEDKNASLEITSQSSTKPSLHPLEMEEFPMQTITGGGSHLHGFQQQEHFVSNSNRVNTECLQKRTDRLRVK